MEKKKITSVDNPKTLMELNMYYISCASVRILMTIFLTAFICKFIVGWDFLLDVLVISITISLWPFVEWFVHKNMLHNTNENFILTKSHLFHHEKPWDLKYVTIPLYTYLFLIPFTVLFWSLFTIEIMFMGIMCFSGIGLFYEWVHMLAHSRFRPKNKFLLTLWKNHRLHHCKDDTRWFGVTSDVADILLETN